MYSVDSMCLEPFSQPNIPQPNMLGVTDYTRSLPYDVLQINLYAIAEWSVKMNDQPVIDVP